MPFEILEFLVLLEMGVIFPPIDLLKDISIKIEK